MAITALSGPGVFFGTVATASGIDLEHNPDRGPTGLDCGAMLLDPRVPYAYQPGQASSKPFYGWPIAGPVVDAIPQTVSSNGIAVAQQPAANTALTLATSANSSSVVSATLLPPEGGAAITIAAIDGAMAGKTFANSVGAVNVWDPTKAICRGLSIVKTSNLDAGNWTIAGRDLYGFKVTESLVSSGVTTMNTVKTYKYISSILPGSAVTSTGVIVGTRDVFGLPLRVDQPGYVTTWYGASSNATLVVTSTGQFTFASTATATNTTADVRGTYASSTASNSTAAAPLRLTMWIAPSIANMATLRTSDTSGLVGVTQFSSV